MARDTLTVLGAIWLALVTLMIIVSSADQASGGAIGAMIFDWMGM